MTTHQHIARMLLTGLNSVTIMMHLSQEYLMYQHIVYSTMFTQNLASIEF